MPLAEQQWCPTSVQVTVQQARGLRIKGKSGTNDAYAVMQVGKEKFQTSVVEKSVAPAWREEAAFDLPPLLHQDGGGGGKERGTLRVHVLHRALVGPDKLLGQAVVNLLQLGEDKAREKTEWFKLLDKTGKADKDRGEVLLDIQFMRHNMTASMFDLSASGKSRSRMGKLKDKVRGKKKESDTASDLVPSFPQVLTESDEEGTGEVAAGKADKKKKPKMKSLFSHKSNLQKNMSQSMTVLTAKNFSLSGSQSSGLNVDSSEGKKKFKFLIHKRSNSSDGKDAPPGQQKHGAAEPSNVCINGSHVYCEEPPPRASRIGSNFSLASSGHGSMEDVRESSPPSVDSLRGVRQYSPWTEEEEEELENTKEDAGQQRREEEEKLRMEEEMRRKEEERVRGKDLERLADEKRRQEEEERRTEEENVKREEEERIRREEEERRQQEEEERVKGEQEECDRLAEQKWRLQEQERLIEEERVRKEEEERIHEERRKEEEMVRRQEEEREEKRRFEEQERRQEEERIRMEEESAQEERRRQEKRVKEQEEERKLAEQKRLEEEERRKEEEMIRRQEEEREEKRRFEEQERSRKEEEERIRMEEESAQEERKSQEEETRVRWQEEECKLAEQKRLEEEERRIEEDKLSEEERIRREEEMAEEERKRREEEEMMKRQEEKQEEKRRLEEQERRRRKHEERIKKEEEQKARREKEEHEKLVEEKRKLEEEERMKAEEEQKARREKEEHEKLVEEEERIKAEQKIRREEEERIRVEEERRKEEERVRRQEEEHEQLVEEKRILEEQERRIEKERKQREAEEMRRREEEENSRKEKEENERLVVEKIRQQERRRIEEEEKIKREEEERIKREEKAERERKEEEARKKEKLTREAEEQKKDNKTEHKAAGKKSGQKVAVESPAEVTSTNPFDENISNNPFEEIPDSPAGPGSSTAKVSTVQQRDQSAASSVGSKPISSDEKDPINTQRERRPAPQPPGRNPAERRSQREPDGATQQLAQINKKSKDKDIKTVSVLPQRSVQTIAPMSRSSTEKKNTQSLTPNCAAKETSNVVKHGKRTAPSTPRSVEEAPSSEDKTTLSSDDNISHECGSAAKQVSIVYSLNPFEDDDVENAAQEESTTPGNTGSVKWPLVAPQAANKDAASRAKTKSSKAHAPSLPAKIAATSSPSIHQNTERGHVAAGAGVTVNSVAHHTCDPASEAVRPIRVQEAPLQESQPAPLQRAGEDAGGVKVAPLIASRRLQPVKPLNPLEQQSVSVVQGVKDNKSTCDVQVKTKVNDAGLKGPYSQLTRGELISLVLKQEKQLSERDKKISELEKYIDDLIVRVIEEKPSILMSLNSMKKGT